MTSEAIRALPTSFLKSIVNGMAGALGHTWANDYVTRRIAAGELRRRGV